MRNVARIKLGYYPLTEDEALHLRRVLAFPAESASVVDPCVGTGRALNLITQEANVEKHGVELDRNRAEAAQAGGIKMIYGNLFNTTGRVESFSLLYLNPPYDSEIATMNNRRMEYLFLDHTAHWLVEGGILVMVVPQKRVEPCISILASDFTNLEVLRLTNPESERFDQVAVIGVRKNVRGKSYEANRHELQKKLYSPQMPELRNANLQYVVPPSKPAMLVYRGLPLDEIEDAIPGSPVWKQIEGFLLPRNEQAAGQPITPLHAGHVALLCTAGLLNGVFGKEEERHIARWTSVKTETTYTVEEEKYTETHKREVFSNELALIYQDGRTLILRDKKTEEKEGEAPVAQAA
jgi:tRNA1(Val) A37 N6-methylase TrmN6